jgi:hypothetical protein
LLTRTCWRLRNWRRRGSRRDFDRRSGGWPKVKRGFLRQDELLRRSKIFVWSGELPCRTEILAVGGELMINMGLFVWKSEFLGRKLRPLRLRKVWAKIKDGHKLFGYRLLHKGRDLRHGLRCFCIGALARLLWEPTRQSEYSLARSFVHNPLMRDESL